MLFVRKRKIKVPGILALIAALVLIATELQAGGNDNEQLEAAMSGTDLTIRAHDAMVFIDSSRAVTADTVDLPN